MPNYGRPPNRRFRPAIWALVSALMLVPSLGADITITSRDSADSSNGHTYSHRILRIKGSKLRLDTGPEAGAFVTIYDLGVGTEIVWDSKHKRAEIHDLLKESAAAQRQVPTAGMRIAIQPTGTQKEFLQRKCRDYSFDLGARETFQGSTSYERLTGTMCVSEEGRESKEVVNFIELARKQGVVFGAPRSSTDARLRTELYFYQSAVRGLVLARNERIELVNGNGTSSSSGQWTLEVESIDTGQIPDELFIIPADWKPRNGGSSPGSIPIRWNSTQGESFRHFGVGPQE